MSSPSLNISRIVIESHTGLRGVAAVYVFVHHFFGEQLGYNFFSPNKVYQYFHLGCCAVDLFFILSGFILNWVYLSGATELNFSNYIRSRIARIIPLYYFTTLCCCFIPLCSVLKHGFAQIGSDFQVKCFLNIFLMSGIVNGPNATINAPAWSISVEFFCYLIIFPLLIYLAKIFLKRGWSEAFLGPLAFITTVCLAFSYSIPPITILGWHWSCSFILRGVWGFSTGFILCSMHRTKSAGGFSVTVVNLVAMVSAIIFFLVVFQVLPGRLILFTYPLIVLSTAADRGALSALLKTGVFQWAGERSYSIYLWHFMFLTPLLPYARALHFHLSEVAFCFGVPILVLVTSEVSYRFFECPCRDYIRRFSLSRPIESSKKL